MQLYVLPVECTKCHCAFGVTIPDGFTLTEGVPELKAMESFNGEACPGCGYKEGNLFDFCDAKIHDMEHLDEEEVEGARRERFREEDILRDYNVLSRMFDSILACPKLLPDGTENDTEEYMTRFARLPESDNAGNPLYYKADDTAW